MDRGQFLMKMEEVLVLYLVPKARATKVVNACRQFSGVQAELSLGSFRELAARWIFFQPSRSWQVYRCQMIEYMTDMIFLRYSMVITKPSERNDLLS